MDNPLIEIRNLNKIFPSADGAMHVLKEISCLIEHGKTTSIVGESGCGKSTLAKILLLLSQPDSGEILFKGQNILSLNAKQQKKYRRNAQMIFQDPYASLNPRMTTEAIVKEPLDIHKIYSKSERKIEVKKLLNLVGLPEDALYRYPHEFSGGQRQRISIARALSLNPDLVICDEPLTALDVSSALQIVRLLKNLQEKLQLTYVFISHDLAMVKQVADRVLVMYLGEIIEEADTIDLYRNPCHPYTKALMSAIPIPNPDIAKKRQRILLQGEIPSPLHRPKGCVFSSRCPLAKEICFQKTPKNISVEPNHRVACHLYDQ